MDNKIDFECEKCGECCRGFSEELGIVLFPDDIYRIPKMLNISSEVFKKKYCYQEEMITKFKRLTIYMLKDINGKCIFLNESNLCEIHEFKPIQCLKGPINIYWDYKMWCNCKKIKTIKLPDDWTTEEEDLKLISTFFKDLIV